MSETGTRCSSLRATEQLDKLADDVIIEIELGVMRELVQRLEKLEAAHQRPVTGKGAIDRVLADDAATPGGTEHLVMLLRANSVTRYKRGDLEIELSRGPLVSAPGLEQWLPKPGDWRKAWPEEPCTPKERAEREAGYTERVPAGPKRCGACHEPEPGHKDGCWVAEAKRDSSPPEVSPDDQPPVEIDMAAVEEKLREQDAKRRGPAQ